jgi:hypothetical protein
LGGLPDAHDELHSFGGEDHHHDPESAVASWGQQ